jgi:hypothetical protein
MSARPFVVLALWLGVAVGSHAQGGGAPAAPAVADPGWPRTFSRDGSTVVLHQPQIDRWDDQVSLHFRMALEVTPAGSTAPQYGVATVTADTHLDSSTNTVLLSNMAIDLGFPGMPDAQAAALKALVTELLPSMTHLSISLDRILAYMHDQPPPPPVKVSVAPPPIYVSSTPAILVVYIGAPQFQPVPGTQLLFAVNTNWPVLLDARSKKYFLLDQASWMEAPDPLNGPWTPASAVPMDELSKLPAGDQWDAVRKVLPGQPFKVVPRVIASTEPAELFVTDGQPRYSPIEGTGLMYVSNPVMPLFMELATGSYFVLVAGRWFRAPGLDGPWASASNSLPAEFARIPADSPVAAVLSSVPGTQPSRDAVLLASVAHKATVSPATAKLDVSYSGPPKFAPITGTSLQYAVNTTYEVIDVSGTYYCCYQAVWFQAPAATGPWTVCSSVPAAIYTIPPDCPVYNVTYVKIYDASPDAVVMGYTGGYAGEYVAPNGVLVYGAGVLTWPQDDCDTCWSCCSPCYYSYGCSAYYDCATGCYGCGNAWYGPYGGAGWASAYNPATGSWVRGAYAYGPCGSYGVHTGYNATTGTWGAHASGHNGYESWGSTAVSQGDKWAQAGHVTNSAGVTHGWAQDSAGQSAQGVHAGNSTVATTSGGDIYAGHDGNVYRKNSDGTWQSYSAGSGWTDTARQPGGNTLTSGASSGGGLGGTLNGAQAHPAQSPWAAHDNLAGLNQDAWSRNLGQSNAGQRFGAGGLGAASPGAGAFGAGGFGGGFGGFRGRR